MKMRLAERIEDLPPYLFASIDEKIARKRKKGEDVISLGVGDPDIPTPKHIVEACCRAARKPENQRYPTYEGMEEFRQAVADSFKHDYRLDLDPEREVITLIGSKEGVHNIHMAFIDPGDIVLYPDPGYPVYNISPLFCGGKVYQMPLLKENAFLPDLEAVPKRIARDAKMMWINYPNNPTAAVADKGFYEDVVSFASENEIIVCSDEAYSKVSFDGYKPPCFLDVKGAMEVGVVFGSLSKTYNMTGWRLGYAVGNEDVIAGLGKVKTNVDSGAPQIIQEAGIAALTSSQKCVQENIKIYQGRRDVLVKGLRKLGLRCEKPKATFYIWLEVPGKDSIAFANRLLDETSVAVTPGIGFGEYGEGFVRFSLTQPVDRIKEALERMEKLDF